MYCQSLSRFVQNLLLKNAPRAVRRHRQPVLQVPGECLEQRRLMTEFVGPIQFPDAKPEMPTEETKEKEDSGDEDNVTPLPIVGPIQYPPILPGSGPILPIPTPELPDPEPVKLNSVPSATFELDKDGILHVKGTDQDDKVSVEPRYKTDESGKQIFDGWDLVVETDGQTVRHSLDGVKGIDANLGDGNDFFEAPSDISVTVNGEAGNDTIIGSNKGDVLSGGDGNDVIRGDGGAYQTQGKGGILLTIRDYAYHREETGGDDRIDGGSGNDELRGGGGRDSITGGSGNDTLEGGAGNDLIDGGSGEDLLDEHVGQTQNYIGNARFDSPPQLVYPANVNLANGTLTHHNQHSSGAREVETDTLKGIEHAKLTGTFGNDRIDATGFTGDVTLQGGLGNDTLIGGRGNDVLDGGAGNDLIRGRAGNDTLTGGTGNDTLNGGTGVDRVRETGLTNAKATSGSLKSEQGKDVLIGIQQLEFTGTKGNDKLDTRSFAGQVTLSGGDGDDWLIGTSFNDVLDGGNGRDVIRSRGGRDSINTADNDSDVVISGRNSLKNDQSQVTKDSRDRVLSRHDVNSNAKVLDAVFSGDLNKLWNAIR